MFEKIKKDPNSFYNKQDFVGAIYAKEIVDEIEAVVKKYGDLRKLEHRELLKYFVPVDPESNEDTWHIFYDIPKCDVKTFQYVIRRINPKSKTIKSISWCQAKYHTQSKKLLKTNLMRFLEVCSFYENKKEELNDYARSMKFYGFDAEDAKERKMRVIESIEERFNDSEVIKKLKKDCKKS